MGKGHGQKGNPKDFKRIQISSPLLLLSLPPYNLHHTPLISESPNLRAKQTREKAESGAGRAEVHMQCRNGGEKGKGKNGKGIQDLWTAHDRKVYRQLLSSTNQLFCHTTHFFFTPNLCRMAFVRSKSILSVISPLVVRSTLQSPLALTHISTLVQKHF